MSQRFHLAKITHEAKKKVIKREINEFDMLKAQINLPEK
jgi:hypothetical protein